MVDAIVVCNWMQYTVQQSYIQQIASEVYAGSSPALVTKTNEMNKRTTYTIFAFEPGSEVYAISMWHDNGAPSDHLAIYKARVSTWSYDAEEKDVLYYLETPREGKSWGDSVRGEFVSDNFEDLLNYAKELWKNETEI